MTNMFNDSMKTKLEKFRSKKPERRIVTAATRLKTVSAATENPASKGLAQQELLTAGGKVWIVKELTPAIAAEMLKHQHPGQRSIREKHMDAIARSMLSDTYVWTGDPIRFDGDNQLIDGQHRLSAVVKSGVTLHDVLCVRVLDDEVHKYIDTAVKPRSANEMRRFLGQRQLGGSVVAAVALEFCDFKHQNRAMLTKVEVNELVESCEFLEELVEINGKANRTNVKLTAASLGVALRCMRLNRVQAAIFFRAISTNTHTIDDVYQPVLKLTIDWLVREGQARATKKRDSQLRAAADDFTLANKLIRAYNAWRLGEKLTKLKTSTSSDELLVPLR
jgi:hypothetical protein